MSATLHQMELPPRLSDMYGEARLDALYRRAAADRERFRQRQDEERAASTFMRLMSAFRR